MTLLKVTAVGQTLVCSVKAGQTKVCPKRFSLSFPQTAALPLTKIKPPVIKITKGFMAFVN